MGIITKNIHGYTVYTYENIPIERIMNPVKSANVKPDISGWARLHILATNQEYKPIKNASEEHELSSWARLHRLKYS